LKNNTQVSKLLLIQLIFYYYSMKLLEKPP